MATHRALLSRPLLAVATAVVTLIGLLPSAGAQFPGASPPSGGSSFGGGAPASGSSFGGSAPAGGSSFGGAAPAGGSSFGGGAPSGGGASGSAPSGQIEAVVREVRSKIPPLLALRVTRRHIAPSAVPSRVEWTTPDGGTSHACATLFVSRRNCGRALR